MTHSDGLGARTYYEAGESGGDHDERGGLRQEAPRQVELNRPTEALHVDDIDEHQRKRQSDSQAQHLADHQHRPAVEPPQLGHSAEGRQPPGEASQHRRPGEWDRSQSHLVDGDHEPIDVLEHDLEIHPGHRGERPEPHPDAALDVPPPEGDPWIRHAPRQETRVVPWQVDGQPAVALFVGEDAAPRARLAHFVGQGERSLGELVARPLISLLFPELARFVQPLAGEYAGRREILESIPLNLKRAIAVGIGL